MGIDGRFGVGSTVLSNWPISVVHTSVARDHQVTGANKVHNRYPGCRQAHLRAESDLPHGGLHALLLQRVECSQELDAQLAKWASQFRFSRVTESFSAPIEEKPNT